MTTVTNVGQPGSNAKAILMDQVRDSYGRVVYTHKTQEKMADMLASWVSKLKLAELLLVALTTGSTLSVVLGSGPIFEIASAILASLTLLIYLIQIRFDHEGRAQEHRRSAKQLWLIREQYLGLICDLKADTIDITSARNLRDQLAEKLGELYQNAPDTNAAAYNAAQYALKKAEELTFSDAELDALLPTTARKKTP